MWVKFLQGQQKTDICEWNTTTQIVYHIHNLDKMLTNPRQLIKHLRFILYVESNLFLISYMRSICVVYHLRYDKEGLKFLASTELFLNSFNTKDVANVDDFCVSKKKTIFKSWLYIQQLWQMNASHLLYNSLFNQINNWNQMCSMWASWNWKITFWTFRAWKWHKSLTLIKSEVPLN